MLVRLVDTDAIPSITQVRDLELAHRGVDQVGILADGAAGTRIQHLDPKLETQAARHTDVGLDRAACTALQVVDRGCREATTRPKVGQGPGTSAAFGADRLTQRVPDTRG